MQIHPTNAGFLDDGSCETRTTCNFTILVVNETTAERINDAYCNMTIYDPNGKYLDEYVMDNVSSYGVWSMNLTWTQQGVYSSDCYCQFDSDETVTDIADCTFIVGSPQNYNRLLHLLLLIFPIGLIGLSRYYDTLHFAVLGALLLMLGGISIFLKLFPFFEFDTGFMMQGFSIILFSLGLYILSLLIPEYWKEVEW